MVFEISSHSSSPSSIVCETYQPRMKLTAATNPKPLAAKPFIAKPLMRKSFTAIATSTRQGKRSVRFADTQGLSLTSIFTFPTSNLSSIVDRRKPRIKIASNGEYAKLLNFWSPSNDSMEILHEYNVSLKNIACNEKGIHGMIQVMNIGYEKDVSVRLTYNAWGSYDEVYASYDNESRESEVIDRFHFHIMPPPGHMKVEFAVCYKVNGVEYWDNNYGDNYRLVYGREL